MKNDIKLLQELLEKIKNTPDNIIETAIENLIKRNKELEEKIKKQKQLTKIAQTITDESLKEALEEFEKDYIPKSKIKEKIEEYRKKRNELANGHFEENPSSINEDTSLFVGITVLQDLLKGEDE